MSLNLDMAAKIWRCALPKGCNKLVLQCYTHHLNDQSGLSWPSISRVACMCGMSPRTVQCHVRALQAAGILRARLRTGRTTRYAIDLSSLTAIVFESDTVVLDADAAVDNFAQLELTPAVSAENWPESAPTPAENDTKPAEICTITLDLTSKNIPVTAAPALPELMMVDGVNPQTLADFAAIRKTKKVGPLNATALETICEQAALAGLTLQQALKACCVKNWGRFEAAWMNDSIRAAITPASATPAAPASQPPEPVKLAAPEVRAAALAAYNAKLSPAKAVPPAMPTGASDINITTGPSWAQGIVRRHQSGQRVTHGVLRDACIVLRINPASLSAVRMH